MLPWNSCRLDDAAAQTVTGGGGGGDAAQTTAFLARADAITLVGATERAAYKALINGGVSDGWFTKLDALYIFATDTAAHALLNLCSSSFNASVITSPTFTADRGYQANISADAIDTGFNASTATTPNFVQNSAHLALWVNTNSTDTLALIGSGSASGTTDLYPKYSDNNMYGRINDSSPGSGSAITNPMGLLIANRSGASAVQHYQNGSSIGSNAQASAAVNNANVNILRDGSGTLSSTVFQISAASMGGSLSSTDASNYYSRMRTYMTAVGVP